MTFEDFWYGRYPKKTEEVVEKVVEPVTKTFTVFFGRVTNKEEEDFTWEPDTIQVDAIDEDDAVERAKKQFGEEPEVPHHIIRAYKTRIQQEQESEESEDAEG